MSHKVFTEKNFTKSLINTFDNLVSLHNNKFIIPILTPEMIAIDKEIPSVDIKRETLHNYKRVEYMFEKNTIDISLFNSIAVMAGKKIQPVDNLISLFTSYLFLLGKIPTNEQINPYKYILELTKEVYTKLHLKPGNTMKVTYKTACRESLQKLWGNSSFTDFAALTLKYIIVYLYALDIFNYSCEHYDTLFIKRLLNNLQSKCSDSELINYVSTSNISLITPANNFRNIHTEHRRYLFKNSSSSPCKVCDIYESGIKDFLQKAFSKESMDPITGYFIVSLLGLSKVLSSEKILKFAAYLKLSESPEYIKYLNCYLNYNFKKYSKSIALFREYTLIDPLVTKSFTDYARIVK